jgi:hypothetical protein
LPLAVTQQFTFCASKVTLAVSTDNEKDFASQNGNRNFGGGRALAINQPHCSHIPLYISSSDIFSSYFRFLRVNRPILLLRFTVKVSQLQGERKIDPCRKISPQISMPSPHRQISACTSSESSTEEEAAKPPQDNPNASQHQEQHILHIGPSHGLSRMEVGACPGCKKKNVRVSFESLPSVLPVILEF